MKKNKQIVTKSIYKVWDKDLQCYDNDVCIDQAGNFFTVTDGWYCEGGGGYDRGTNQARYELHLTHND